MNKNAIMCSQQTATRLAGAFDLMGQSVEETPFGFEVNKLTEDRIYLKYSSDHKDSVEAVLLLNKVLPVSTGLSGLLNIAQTSFLECFAIVMSENLDDNARDVAYVDALYANYVKKFYCRAKNIWSAFGEPGNLISKWKSDLGF